MNLKKLRNFALYMTIFLAFSEPYGDSIMLAFKNIFSQGDIIIKKNNFLFISVFVSDWDTIEVT